MTAETDILAHDLSPSTPPYHLINELHMLDKRYHIGYEASSVTRAADELALVIPRDSFTLLSDEGSSAVVFRDQQFAYKVSRGGDYSYIEHEASMMHLLGRAELAPKLEGLIDCAPQCRYASRQHGPIKYDDTFPRCERDELSKPILVSELISVSGDDSPYRFDALPRSHIVDEFTRIATFALAHRVNLGGDVELVVDQATKQLKYIDVGGATIDHTISDEAILAGILRPLAFREYNGKVIYLDAKDEAATQTIARLYQQGGLEKVADMITAGTRTRERVAKLLGMRTQPRQLI